MSTSSIGSLRDRVVLESASRADDGGGGATVTWGQVAELWAAIRPISGEERLRADRVAGRVTHKVVIRNRSGVVPAMRFRSGDHVLEIVAVLDAGRRSRLACLCEERFL